MVERAESKEERIAHRAALFEQASAHTGRVSIRTRAGHFLVRTEDEVVAAILVAKGRRSEIGVLDRAMAVLSALGRADHAVRGLFVDVGANIGTSTVAALRAHRFAGAVAFEPEADNLTTLRINLHLNGVADLVTVVPGAASDVTGALELAIDPRNSGGHQVAHPATTGPSGPAAAHVVESVPCMTVDDALADCGLESRQVGMLWIDAQGHEPAVLRGASSIVRHGTPVVLEYDPRSLSATNQLDALRRAIQWRYRWFVDLRAASRDQRVEPDSLLTPTSQLDCLERQYEAAYTDVLLV